MSVRIVELTSGITTTAWLCPTCLAAKQAAGWTAKVGREVAQLCDGCPKPPTPKAVDFVPTSPGGRRPTRAECPPPKPIAPWPKPKTQQTKRTETRGASDAVA